MTREEMREKVADAIAYAWDMEGRVMDAADAAIALVLEEAASMIEARWQHGVGDHYAAAIRAMINRA